jgi:hypothetical protein
MRKLLLPAALCAAFATVAVAPASASTDSAKANAAYSHKQQDNQIHKLRGSIKGIGKALALLLNHDKANKASIDTILAGVPTIVSGLTQLKDGLTTLSSAYKAVEYGVLHTVINIGGANVADMPNQYSSDIPDDGNGAQVAGEIPFATPAGVSGATMKFNVKAAIRSAEADGNATGDPVGQVGGLIFVTCNAVGGCGSSTTEGAVLCLVQTPNQTYSFPDGTTKSLGVMQIQNRTERTDQSRPTDDPNDPTTVDANDGFGCSFTAVASTTYVVHTVYQFFDFPTSTSPGATD